eukprot:c13280_g1_i1.p1 GENE.c13280_g1_i1~~c13280_g1_i1.p1  ORF type:complete len:133 (-),score=15.73 c13280_g1_i1:6-404(-)
MRQRNKQKSKTIIFPFLSQINPKTNSFFFQSSNDFKSYLFIFLFSVIIYINSIWGEFVFDDVEAIVNNQDITDSNLFNLWKNDFWGFPMNNEKSHKSYRPLTVITFRLSYLLNGLDPYTFHLINILLHAINR